MPRPQTTSLRPTDGHHTSLSTTTSSTSCGTRQPRIHVTATIILLYVITTTTLAFYPECGECDRQTMCAPPPPDCTSGHVLDSCDCCSVCARGVNQTCQGPYGQLGRCADTLVCVTEPRPGEAISVHDEGICKAKHGMYACVCMDVDYVEPRLLLSWKP